MRVHPCLHPDILKVRDTSNLVHMDVKSEDGARKYPAEDGQHFLMSPECRTLTFAQVASIGEDEAYEIFLRFRWPDTDGKPTCRHCGVIDCYEVRNRKFKCSGCRREFSVTSGTVFAYRKLPFTKLITAMWLSVNAVKGLAALHLSRLIGTQFKTAWVMLMKIREALGYRREGMVLQGEVQMDGKYAGGHVKQANRTQDRIDRRLKRHQNMKRVCVLALREKNARGMERTFTRIVREENGPAALANVSHHVDRKAVVVTDEHPSYNDIVAKNEHRRVNHSEAFSTKEGVNTNHVESFFSRVQRAYVGIHHHFSLKYFDWYMAEIAWREDNRKRGNGRLTAMVLMTVMQAPTSRNLCGYWQGNSPPEPDFSDVLNPFKPI